MQHNAAFHRVFSVREVKEPIFRQKYDIFMKLKPDIITPRYVQMEYPKFIVSNQKEESISMQRIVKQHKNFS